MNIKILSIIFALTIAYGCDKEIKLSPFESCCENLPLTDSSFSNAEIHIASAFVVSSGIKQNDQFVIHSKNILEIQNLVIQDYKNQTLYQNNSISNLDSFTWD